MTAVTERTAVRRLRHAPEERPMIVIWEVTRACALVCLHCRADAQHRRNPHSAGDAARGQAGGNGIDFAQQLAVGERSVGAIIDDRQLIGRAFRGKPNEIEGGAHVSRAA